MTRRGWGVLTALLAALLCALSMGGELYYYTALLLLSVFLYSLSSCLWARQTAFCGHRLSAPAVFRGESARLILQAGHKGLLPVAPLRAEYRSGDQAGACEFPARPMTTHEKQISLSFPHVGAYDSCVERLIVSDLFGLFEMKRRPLHAPIPLLSLPRPFDIEKPRIIPGDEGLSVLSRTQEDYNAPEDVRSYQPGDAMKRIHWKLSSRRRELVVRRFEMPSPPDTLILLDCAQPLGEYKENLRDALCETAVAIAKLQMEDGSPVRLPIYGEKANEFSSDHAKGLSLLQEMLAMQPFRGGEDFARVLQMELRRMRRTGATVMITTRLDARIVEAVSAIRRMGPSARLYLVTHIPDSPEYQPFVARLQHHLVEVCYVTPA